MTQILRKYFLSVRNHWKKTLAILIGLLIIIGCFWYLWENQNLIINKEFRLKKTVMEYSELIEFGFHDEVYNEFLTPSSKLRTITSRREVPMTNQEIEAENNRLAQCKTGSLISQLDCNRKARHERQFEDYQIPAIESFKRYAQDRKDYWTDIQIEKIVYPQEDRADIRLKVKDRKHSDTAPIETWYYIDGKWLRDF